MMNHQQLSASDSIGYGSLGCAGGLLLGLFGGGLLLLLLSLGWAVVSPVSVSAPAAGTGSDLRLTLSETFLNRVVRDSMGEAAQVDVLPDNELSVSLEADASELGLPISIPVMALFEFQLLGQSLNLSLVDVRVSGFTAPPQLLNLFNDRALMVNRDLNMALEELSNTLGTPLVLTGLGTDQTSFWIEAREAP
ncbi:MAG TPA: hypothetical protein VGD99_12150 [Anaerolineae bacterium]|jgi:hypothetical protein